MLFFARFLNIKSILNNLDVVLVVAVVMFVALRFYNYDHLKTENIRLTQANQELQSKLDEVEKDRVVKDDLSAKVVSENDNVDTSFASLEKRMQDNLVAHSKPVKNNTPVSNAVSQTPQAGVSVASDDIQEIDQAWEAYCLVVVNDPSCQMPPRAIDKGTP